MWSGWVRGQPRATLYEEVEEEEEEEEEEGQGVQSSGV